MGLGDGDAVDAGRWGRRDPVGALGTAASASEVGRGRRPSAGTATSAIFPQSPLSTSCAGRAGRAGCGG